MKASIHPSPTSESEARPGGATDPEAIQYAVLEKSPLLVYVANLEFKIVLLNRGLRETTGYDTADCGSVEALLKKFYPHAEYRAVVEQIHEGWKRNEHIRGAELVVQCKSGQQRTISWSTSRLRIGRGPTLGYIAMGVDMTTRRSLEQWVGLLQRSLQHLHEGVVLTDPTGAVLAWNAGAARLFGWSDAEMQGRPLADLFLRGEREILARTMDRAVTADGSWTGEIELEKRGGGTAFASAHVHRLDGDGGAPLARLHVFAPPDASPASPEAAAREAAERGRLEAEIAALKAAVEGRPATPQPPQAEPDPSLTEARDERDQARATVLTLRERIGALESSAAAAAAQLIGVEEQLEAARAAAAQAAEGNVALDERARAAEQRAEAAEQRASASEARAAEGTARADALANDLKAAEQRAALAEAAQAAAVAESSAARTELEGKLRAVQEELDAAEQRATKDAETQAEAHRTERESLVARSAEERRALEEQLHKDILAAEERSETERQKLLAEFAKERADLEQAAEIGRAEIESRAQRRVEEEREAAGKRVLGRHLAALSPALFAADTSGRIVACSAGGERLLGGKPDATAVLHKDVLAVDGVDWKSLFAKVLIAGRMQREVTVHTASGPRALRLDASLVRGDHGAPLGVIELLEAPAVGVTPDLYARAAAGRLIEPWRALLDARSGDGLRKAVESRDAVDPLVRFARAFLAGSGLPELERITRDGELQRAAQTAEERVDEALQAWRETRATLADLQAVVSAIAGDDKPLRWNELVERCLSGFGLARAKRQFGDAGLFEGRKDLAVATIVTLLHDADAGLLSVRTARDGDLVVLGLRREGVDKKVAGWLAGEAGGSLVDTADGVELRLPARPRAHGDQPASPLALPATGERAPQHAEEGEVIEGVAEGADTDAGDAIAEIVAEPDGPDEDADRGTRGASAEDPSTEPGRLVRTQPSAKPPSPPEPPPGPPAEPSLTEISALDLRPVEETRGAPAGLHDDDLELDELLDAIEANTGRNGRLDGLPTLEMAGVEDGDIASREEASMPSDHPVLSSGTVDGVVETDDGVLAMAGEDSLVTSGDVVYKQVRSLHDGDPVLGGDVMPLDELEEIDDGEGSVSADLLRELSEMEVYARRAGSGDDLLDLDDDDANGAFDPSAPGRQPSNPGILEEMRREQPAAQPGRRHRGKKRRK